MPERNDDKNRVKTPVKDLAREITSDIVYRIAKAGTKRAINDLTGELRKKSAEALQRKLKNLSGQSARACVAILDRKPAAAYRKDSGAPAIPLHSMR